MSRVQMERHLAGQKLSGKVAFVATLLFPILGVACLLLSEQVAAHLPHILGAVMLFVGAADIFTDLLDKGSVPDKITVGTDVVMIVLGVVTLLNTTESLNVIAVMWGLLGLEKAAHEIDESLEARASSGEWLVPLATGAFELVLGTMLLIAPSRTSAITCSCSAWSSSCSRFTCTPRAESNRSSWTFRLHTTISFGRGDLSGIGDVFA